MKIAPAQQYAFTKALIEESGGNPNKINLSYALADRSRRTVAHATASSCKHQWNVPKLASLHWVSKIMPSLKNANVREERLTVASGTSHSVKILGIPAYTLGTEVKSDEMIAKLVTGLLDEWGSRESIINMAFDTTASNTGHLTAACVAIQQYLEQALLWSGCRHHIGEVLLTHVFNDLKIETSQCPESALFLRFRKNFESLLYESNAEHKLSRLDLSGYNKST